MAAKAPFHRRPLVWAFAPAVLVLFVALRTLAGVATYAPAAAPAVPTDIDRWIESADDGHVAGTACTELLRRLPTISDRRVRARAWRAVVTAAGRAGRVDVLPAAAESALALNPNDLEVMRECQLWLVENHVGLDIAQRCATRSIAASSQHPDQGAYDTDVMQLLYALAAQGKDHEAVARYEQYLYDGKRTTVESIPNEMAEALKDPERVRAIIDAMHGQDPFTGEKIDAAKLRQQATDGANASAMVESAREYVVESQAEWRKLYADGRAVPPTAFRDPASGAASHPDLAHGLAVVCFWRMDSDESRFTLPALEQWMRRPRSVPVRMWTVAVEPAATDRARARIRDWTRSFGFVAPVLVVDSMAAASWGVERYPATFVLRNGVIQYNGFAGDFPDGLDDELASLGSRGVAGR